jgi:hypothetical protein
MAASAALERVSSLCFPWTCPCVRSTTVCIVRVWPAAACLCVKCSYLFNSSQCCAKRSCLQQLVLHLYCLSARACAEPGRVYLHGLLCYTCVSVYKSFVLHTDVSGFESFVLHLDVSAYKSFVLHLDVPVYKSFVTHLDVSVYKSAAQAVTVGVLLKSFLVCFGLFRNSSVCFGCFDIGSKHRNKQKYFVFGFTKQTETNAKQILFRFVSVRTEIYFCLFRGHPSFVD